MFVYIMYIHIHIIAAASEFLAKSRREQTIFGHLPRQEVGRPWWHPFRRGVQYECVVTQLPLPSKASQIRINNMKLLFLR